MAGTMLQRIAVCLIAGYAAVIPARGSAEPAAKDSGYRGIWFTLGQKCEYGDKYSGGLGTYTANHVPMAIYAPAANKTFFVYGGGKNGQRHLLNMLSYYDHTRKVVPRPTIVHDKQGVNDPHDNPSLAIDAQGHLWVFVSGRGRVRPGFVYRSVKPYDIEDLEQVSQHEFTYPQPRWIEDRGFLHLFTKYTKGRNSTSVPAPTAGHGLPIRNSPAWVAITKPVTSGDDASSQPSTCIPAGMSISARTCTTCRPTIWVHPGRTSAERR